MILCEKGIWFGMPGHLLHNVYYTGSRHNSLLANGGASNRKTANTHLEHCRIKDITFFYGPTKKKHEIPCRLS